MTSHNRSLLSRTLIGLAIGCACGVIGLMPWLVGGARLPLQNLWESNVLPADMPLSLLPVSQYFAMRIAALLIVGGALAGLVVRLVRPALGIPSWAAAAGVGLMQGIAIVQSFTVVADGLGISRGNPDARALVYFGGMLGGTLATALLAQAAFWLVSRRSVGVAALGLSLSAVPFASWIMNGVEAASGPAGIPADVLLIARWLPAVLVGIVLGWCGIRPLRRLTVWAVALTALWITPAIVTALSYALGMRVLNGDLREMSEAASQIFPVALGIEGLPVLLALVLGGLITGAREIAGRRATDVREELQSTP